MCRRDKKLKAKLESAKALGFDQINTEFLKAEYNKINFITGLNQGCLLASFFFTPCIDWIMRETNKRTEISLSMSEMLGDPDFQVSQLVIGMRINNTYTRS